jgi:hypothetical protein
VKLSSRIFTTSTETHFAVHLHATVRLFRRLHQYTVPLLNMELYAHDRAVKLGLAAISILPCTRYLSLTGGSFFSLTRYELSADRI